MPYRTNARVVESVDDGEVDAIAREARGRRRRVALGVSGLLTAGVLFGLVAVPQASDVAAMAARHAGHNVVG